MDGLRIEGEAISGLPAQSMREEIMQSWYKGVDLKKINYYRLDACRDRLYDRYPKREFVEQIVNKHLLPETAIRFDRVNYLRAGNPIRTFRRLCDTCDYVQALRSMARPGTSFFKLVNDYSANLAYVRVRRSAGKDVAFTIVVNRWHDNVNFLVAKTPGSILQRTAPISSRG